MIDFIFGVYGWGRVLLNVFIFVLLINYAVVRLVEIFFFLSVFLVLFVEKFNIIISVKEKCYRNFKYYYKVGIER